MGSKWREGRTKGETEGDRRQSRQNDKQWDTKNEKAKWPRVCRKKTPHKRDKVERMRGINKQTLSLMAFSGKLSSAWLPLLYNSRKIH